MLDGFVDVSKTPKETLNVIEWSASFSVKPFQTMFNLVMSTFLRSKYVRGRRAEGYEARV